MKTKYLIYGSAIGFSIYLFFKLQKKNTKQNSIIKPNSINENSSKLAIVKNSDIPDPITPQVENLAGTNTSAESPTILTVSTIGSTTGIQKGYITPEECKDVFKVEYSGIQHIYKWNSGKPTLEKFHASNTNPYFNYMVNPKTIFPIKIPISKADYLKACEDFKSGQYVVKTTTIGYGSFGK